ncbi:hypothetical protein FA95DRAFT_1613618 [Auriscalpium vulgare]|uniref:Uncharacterized protein n=1 Tax=Auriscalpium vulgare TaxID=40419 RepID=A0ACB8R1X9_9AGAM|nr:hypothetical protein FA95DRAFT_1613618 [Auriscalpium vulgare]
MADLNPEAHNAEEMESPGGHTTVSLSEPILLFPMPMHDGENLVDTDDAQLDMGEVASIMAKLHDRMQQIQLGGEELREAMALLQVRADATVNDFRRLGLSSEFRRVQNMVNTLQQWDSIVRSWVSPTSLPMQPLAASIATVTSSQNELSRITVLTRQLHDRHEANHIRKRTILWLLLLGVAIMVSFRPDAHVLRIHHAKPARVMLVEPLRAKVEQAYLEFRRLWETASTAASAFWEGVDGPGDEYLRLDGNNVLDGNNAKVMLDRVMPDFNGEGEMQVAQVDIGGMQGSAVDSEGA